MILKLANVALFQAVWLVCILAGKHHRPLAAVTAAMVAVGVSLWRLDGGRLAALRLWGLVAAVGFCVDSANLLMGVFALHGPSRFPYLCPLWLLALWVAFGTTLRGPLSWLAGRYWLSAVLGAVAGPASYAGGARLGAAALAPNRVFSIAALAVTWALVMPLLVWLAHRWRPLQPGKDTP